MKKYEFKGLNIKPCDYTIVDIKNATFSFRRDTSRFDGKIETPTGAIYSGYFSAETPIYYKRVGIEAKLTGKYKV